eukprot:CAMPEP_0182796740 /NCGR_PEP_ID=MMETSP0006_2-20121128/432_1 /TAXON_ID=97485 /ORGANISM="Prymnesium parvum, Strain Texoma1" /LENGTH=316 /DNA_ID=CAMNT_0024921719 /DNA_START=382 /DNA_END=1329 /DNA_ORIENTATION=-
MSAGVRTISPAPEYDVLGAGALGLGVRVVGVRVVGGTSTTNSAAPPGVWNKQRITGPAAEVRHRPTGVVRNAGTDDDEHARPWELIGLPQPALDVLDIPLLEELLHESAVHVILHPVKDCGAPLADVTARDAGHLVEYRRLVTFCAGRYGLELIPRRASRGDFVPLDFPIPTASPAQIFENVRRRALHDVAALVYVALVVLVWLPRVGHGGHCRPATAFFRSVAPGCPAAARNMTAPFLCAGSSNLIMVSEAGARSYNCDPRLRCIMKTVIHEHFPARTSPRGRPRADIDSLLDGMECMLWSGMSYRALELSHFGT